MKKITIFISIFTIILLGFTVDSYSDKSLISQTVSQKLKNDPDFKPYYVILQQLAKNTSSKPQIKKEKNLKKCRDAMFGVKFLCRPEWELTVHKNEFKLITKLDASVIMTVSRIEKEFFSLYQLNPSKLQRIGNYAPGFVQSEVEFGGQTAFKIKAFTANEPQARLTDFYVFYEEAMYRVSFAVHPKELWDEHKFLIKELIEGFKF